MSLYTLVSIQSGKLHYLTERATLSQSQRHGIMRTRRAISVIKERYAMSTMGPFAILKVS